MWPSRVWASSKGSASSRRYMERQLRDPWVKRAAAEQFRARSSFKLLELIDKHRLIPRAGCIVDCGAAPGGWSQVVAQRMGAGNRLVAIDLLPMAPVGGAQFIQGDFLDPAVKAQVRASIGTLPVGLVLSDMAPAFTGHRSVDAARAMDLCEDVVAFADEVLAHDGCLVLKFFMGGGEAELRQALRAMFRSVAVAKPAASRKESAENYLVCVGKLHGAS
ncbi:2' O-ribose methyltransferase [Coemansia nantahalensis]|uniref:2' O-ribose methyltransferase n=1 Tax=Coemansia helicoidea TaxID=1286919 RepID=A0ACC1KSG7_9FUNG|nr:2' O-ribose methyltransferase [Coemansia nantahalensis]KAJ2793845.1 2' O-ribose methyltransferase [Coemansia helicoidea]